MLALTAIFLIVMLRWYLQWEPKWLPHKNYTARKKWSRNGSTVEPFSCPQDGPHLGYVLVPLCKVMKWYRFLPKKVDYDSGKRLHCGTILANGTTLDRGTVFSQTWLLRKKWYRFSKGFHCGAVMPPLFFSVSKSVPFCKWPYLAQQRRWYG